ncbi:MAG TPA: AAA family ATPase [Solirubrobacteraceae bacterium]|jgi:chromosome segregation protein|nr:AAA family ATPase [Solirubrobacteraceae bacterium]
MYLKSVTLKGFKSFPDRTRLEFGPGVSVVVGPNGSGKSNVTDAVLWALGEQSPVAVRGQSMQDVIFGGAPGRQAAKSAEVELVLDDSEGVLGLGTPEISIVRRLDRSGEGEYRLAGARCRLVDVIELLSDTGLGKEMHSVISQGRVEAIVTSKPRDRRLLIEEAAGLGKHRKRRRRATLKLERTQDNLDRALDVEREARLRLRPLKRQAEAAELHARLERQSLEVRWDLARDDVRARRAELALAQADAARARQQRAAVEAELQTVGQRREAAEEALQSRSAQREELSRRSFTAQSAAERIGYRAEAVRTTARSLDGRIASNGERLVALRREHEAAPLDPAARGHVDALQTELDALERDRDAELARQLSELEGSRETLAGTVEALSERVSQTQEVRAAGDAGLESARQGVREAERAVEAARREAARIGGELAAVNQFLRSQHTAPEGATSLADELNVDPGFELAVAAVLDGRLGAALVSAHHAAATLLDRAGEVGGRALVWAGGEGEPAASAAPEVPPGPGARRLVDHVRGSGPALALARLLLRDVWVVESVEALAAGFAGTAVTRSGRVWAAGAFELRQAPAVGEEQVLAERNRREGLIADSERAAQAEHAARGALERALAEVARVDVERERTIAAHRTAVRERDEAAEEERRLAATIDRRRRAPDEGLPGAERRAQLRAEIAAESAALARVEREYGEREATIIRMQAMLARDRDLVPLFGAVAESIVLAGEAVTAQRALFEAALAADREAGEHVAGELRACAQQEAALHTRLHAENERLTGLEVRASRSSDQATEAERELATLAERLELEAAPAEQPLPDEERADLVARLERLTRRREQLGPVNPLAQDEYAEALAHVEELERQRADLETALRELEQLIKDTDREIRETFERTFTAAAANFEELAERLFPGGHGRLRLVTERDGPARVLGGSGGAEAPDGDDAEIAASDDDEAPEDLLGVEIEITPAGKAMKRLSLLSGGEKSMTALAFLFSVFLAKPCPFYILDEVEAALDDLNIDRFLELLDTYSERAQFIVVTHQKRTMEAADTLYGVSMGGDGISKVISQRMPPREGAPEPHQAVA